MIRLFLFIILMELFFCESLQASDYCFQTVQNKNDLTSKRKHSHLKFYVGPQKQLILVNQKVQGSFLIKTLRQVHSWENKIERQNPWTQELTNEWMSELFHLISQPYKRRNFSKELLEKLKVQMRDDFNRQFTIIVSDLNGTPLGSIRIIFSPYLALVQEGQSSKPQVIPWMSQSQLYDFLKNKKKSKKLELLPVETFFDYTLKRPTFSHKNGLNEKVYQTFFVEGKKFLVRPHFITEISSLSVLKSNHRKEVRSLLAQEMIVSGFYKPFTLNQYLGPTLFSQGSQSYKNTDSLFIFSYGEKVGARMYQPLGFKVSDLEKVDSSGVKWNLLAYNRSLLWKSIIQENPLSMSPYFDQAVKEIDSSSYPFVSPTGLLDISFMSESEDLTQIFNLMKSHGFFR